PGLGIPGCGAQGRSEEVGTGIESVPPAGRDQVPPGRRHRPQDPFQFRSSNAVSGPQCFGRREELVVVRGGRGWADDRAWACAGAWVAVRARADVRGWAGCNPRTTRGACGATPPPRG